ncbi:hypothetical protein HPB51_020528 [Rhipicephalus microplus]|uniref:Uncharacterized protein n=1 Tax=Rhipicephalus microplus TaxID=6941 RepID=A0A9J6EV72_RHIMP|nr:hypothetical protein HPB51_020528 [Rhipicephalus microplus]
MYSPRDVWHVDATDERKETRESYVTQVKLTVSVQQLIKTSERRCGDDDGGSRRSSEGGRRKRRRRRRLLSAGPCCSERPTSTTTAGAAAMLLNEPSTMNTVTGARNANGTSQGVSDAGSVAKEQVRGHISATTRVGNIVFKQTDAYLRASLQMSPELLLAHGGRKGNERP